MALEAETLRENGNIKRCKYHANIDAKCERVVMVANISETIGRTSLLSD
jgi:hypothetical protein